MVYFGEVRNLQGTENARKIKLNLQGKEIAEKWSLEGNGTYKYKE